MLIRAATSEDPLEFPGGFTKARALRKTSDQEFFPWTEATAPFIHVPQGTDAVDSVVSYVCDVDDKRALLETADSDDLILATWPGKMRQDIFVLDDREQALAGLVIG